MRLSHFLSTNFLLFQNTIISHFKKLNQTNPTEVEALLREMHIKKFYPTQEIAQIYFSSFIAQHDFELTFSKFKSWCDTSLGNAINRVELCLFILDQMLHIQKSQ